MFNFYCEGACKTDFEKAAARNDNFNFDADLEKLNVNTLFSNEFD